MPGERGTELERLMRRTVIQEDGCWMWTGGTNEQGYGKIRRSGARNGSPIAVHRLAFLLLRGGILDGMHLDHLCHSADMSCSGGPSCRHRRCLNPDHLEAVTPRVNVRRGRRTTNPPKCPAGHPYNAENTRYRKDGTQSCVTCRRVRQKAKYEADPEWREKRLAATREWKRRERAARSPR